MKENIFISICLIMTAFAFLNYKPQLFTKIIFQYCIVSYLLFFIGFLFYHMGIINGLNTSNKIISNKGFNIVNDFSSSNITNEEWDKAFSEGHLLSRIQGYINEEKLEEKEIIKKIILFYRIR